ncbi:hypothetical protein AGMMS49959_05510 [Planctomycetales bacterium]|nr:hypothetical protein AGMMS49959_05510 [Planctomycetales bacterium]
MPTAVLLPNEVQSGLPTTAAAAENSATELDGDLLLDAPETGTKTPVLIVSSRLDWFDEFIAAAPRENFNVQAFSETWLAQRYLMEHREIEAVLLGLPLAGATDLATWIKIKYPSMAVVVVDYEIMPDELLMSYLNNGASAIFHYHTPVHEVVGNLRGIIKKQQNVGNDHILAVEAGLPAQNWVEMTMLSKDEYLGRVQRFSEQLLRHHLSPEEVNALCMALEEFGRNAMEWGNKFDAQKRVVLRYVILETEILMVFIDEGEGFDWLAKIDHDPTKNLKEHLKSRKDANKRPGGFGMFMMRKMMDEVFYNAKGNVCVMKKKFNRADFRETPTS